VEKSWSFHIGPVYFDGAVLVMTVLTCAIIFGLFWASRRMTILRQTKCIGSHH
jgi:F-type H+-transporting ATPase subunit a